MADHFRRIDLLHIPVGQGGLNFSGCGSSLVIADRCDGYIDRLRGSSQWQRHLHMRDAGRPAAIRHKQNKSARPSLVRLWPSRTRRIFLSTLFCALRDSNVVAKMGQSLSLNGRWAGGGPYGPPVKLVTPVISLVSLRNYHNNNNRIHRYFLNFRPVRAD